jgi:hypothetical protein
MARGGKRPHAGRPKGSQDPHTKSKQATEDAYRAFMQADEEARWRVQRERALGVYVLMVRTAAGYVRITDPEQIADIMRTPPPRGTTAWLIEAQAPDPALVKEINNRTMGVPTQLHEVGTAEGAPLPVRIVHQEVKDARID